MMRHQILTLLTLGALAGTAGAGPVWVQSWSDEFNAPANTGLNTAAWNVETGGGGWGNNELQSYTNRTQNIRHNGAGQLIVEARAETFTGTDGITRNYTSGRFQSNGKVTQAYGRFEAYVRIPYTQGTGRPSPESTDPCCPTWSCRECGFRQEVEESHGGV
jgi:beta-glucanase (GH16 family)